MTPELDHTLYDDRGPSDFIPTVTRFLRVVRRRRQVVVNSLAIAGAIGLAYYALAAREYESAAKLLIIEPNDDQMPSMADHNNSDNTMTTHRELVSSPVVLEGAIRRLAPAYRVDLV